MSSDPYIVPLPAHPSIEQLKKQAKDLQRAVRGRRPVALELAAHHAPHRLADPAAFTLDAAQLVIARRYGFAGWQPLRRHIEQGDGVGGSARDGIRTAADYYRLRLDRAAEQDVRRCVAAARGRWDPGTWVPLLTARRNGVTVLAFDAPSGIVFAELTPTRITLATLGTRQARRSAGSQATVACHTRFGTIAGLVDPDVVTLAVERPADIRARERAVLAHGVFVVPNGFLVDETGVVLRTGDRPRGEIVPFSALPPQAEAVIDRPVPESGSGPAAPDPAEQLTAVLESADTPPIVDPELWRPGVLAQLTDVETVQLGRYQNLLEWHHTGAGASLADPFVFDFTPQHGPIRDFTLSGRGLSITRMYYDYREGPGKVAVVGLIDDDRAVAVTLRRPGLPDLPAHISGGTFLIAAPDLADLREDGRDRAFVVAVDREGHALEQLAYRE